MDRATQDRLVKAYDQASKELQKEMEELFPEMFNGIPFVYENQLFIRKQYPRNLYQLIVQQKQFKIRNLKDNVLWDTQQNATNYDLVKAAEDRSNGYYLDRFSFNKLLKRGSASTSNIALIDSKTIIEIHQKMFNND